MLGFDHVEIAVVRKLRMKPIAWLGGLPMPKVVRENDEIALSVEQLSLPKQLAGEFLAKKLLSRPGCAVQDQNRVSHDAAIIAPGRAERMVVDLHVRQG